MAPRRLNVTLGTAGHVDHGKTLLTKMLTGCETDRLKEEKERGMSIELGFAPCTISDLEVGIVDVPGHETFVKTMVAGAAGMDGVIFLVAADDGIMPQTREHLDILTLLGIRHGIVALTKIDRVDAERREFVKEQTRHLLTGTFLESAPILPISNITGEGFPDFLEALDALVRSITPRSTEGVFRLPVERAFSVKGYGTVVAGIPVSGSIRVGDEVTLLPQGLAGRIAGLEVYGQTADTALAGQCAALQLRHWDSKTIERGNVVTLAGFFAADEWYVCRLRLLAAQDFTLKNAMPLKFQTGTSEVLAAVYLLEDRPARSGDETFVQFKLDRPLVAGPGDPFIVRSLTPVRTVGGGRILEATPRRIKRGRPGLVEEFAERGAAVGAIETFVEYCLKHAPQIVDGSDELSLAAKAPKALLERILTALVDAGRAMRVAPGLYLHRDTGAAAEAHVKAILAEFHRAKPESPGLGLEELAAALGLDKERARLLVELLKTRGAVAERVGRLALPDHRETLPDKDQKLLEAVEAQFQSRAFNPPSAAEAAAVAGASPEATERMIRLLIERQVLIRVDSELVFHSAAVSRARELLVDFLRREGRLESVKFKYLLETTRKYALPLLDYFDRVGVTRSVGHTRFLRP